ncbi:DUF2303 family protein [Variovorax boronicumulans]|uniref:DUF2303 family protein n=1 Tax=Variovorax boronicumulans TaxID=436515 RepID=UPI0012E64672|nr:DUF2303 family protein [Variovorax boronicumulans]GER16730.1 DUF2303 domain-containing protein [Variovorax boronicumulans]
MTEAITHETAQLVSNLTAAGIAPKQIGDSYHVVVPQGFRHADLTDMVEKAQLAPSRKHGTVVLSAVSSLLAYCADQAAQATGYIYADPDSRKIVAVFNDARLGTGWRDHRAVFEAELTPEAKRWLASNGKVMAQDEFATFIEDNQPDLQGEDATNLLTVATTMQAKSDINFSASKRLQDGQTQLVYNEVINASAGASGEFKIPKTFALGLRIFKNGVGYKLAARLKFRLHSGSVKFWYELERPEVAIEDAFKGYVDEVATKSGYTVLLGKA